MRVGQGGSFEGWFIIAQSAIVRPAMRMGMMIESERFIARGYTEIIGCEGPEQIVVSAQLAEGLAAA